jgi:hypothetical protein
MEPNMQTEAEVFQAIYDSDDPANGLNFLDLQGLSRKHVLKEEDLVIPLLDHVISDLSKSPDKFVGLKEVARVFSAKHLEMEKEHEAAKSTAHKYAELVKIAKNERAYNIWSSLESHMDLESKALELAWVTASNILRSH